MELIYDENGTLKPKMNQLAPALGSANATLASVSSSMIEEGLVQREGESIRFLMQKDE